MRDEQMDKSISEKLHSLEQLPEEIAFEKAEAWNKLALQLHQSKKKSFPVFKMAVAACLLVIVLCGAFYLWKSDLKNELHYASKKLNTNNQPVNMAHTASSEGKIIAATTHHLQPELYNSYTKPYQNRKKRKLPQKQLQTPSRAEKKKNTASFLAAADVLPPCYLSGSEYAQPGYYP